MGLFGNDNKKLEIELHRKIAHNANEINGEVGSIVEEADSNGEKFTNVSGKLLRFTEEVLDDLHPEQRAELIQIASEVSELHKSYNTLFRSILDLSSKQNKRTKDAINEYERIGSR